jgi:hypothetical protein
LRIGGARLRMNAAKLRMDLARSRIGATTLECLRLD